MKRRIFIRNSTAATSLISVAPQVALRRANKPLNMLILGGTDFLGPAIVKAGIAAGHTIALYNRGITNPYMFPELPLIKGDRERGLPAYEPLKQKKWDVVIDVWPQQSRLVDEATTALQHHTEHYVFISSIAVYRDFNQPGRAEQDPLVSLPVEKKEWGYPEEKAVAEALVAERFPGNHTILRPGAIKGWRDPARDLLYWLIKLDRNESILAPGDGADYLQYIDVHDVGNFAIDAASRGLAGTFNCVGPSRTKLSWKTFLESAKAHLESTSELHWSSQARLKELGIRPWDDLPLWAPATDDYFMQISSAKALAKGFTYSPIAKTIEDCLAWHKESGSPDIAFGLGDQPVGLDRKRELEAISRITAG